MNIEFKNYILLSSNEHKEILEIRNSNYIRHNMNNKDIIEINAHLQWVENLKKDTKNIYYAVLIDEEILGAVYITEINYKDSTSTWGLYFKNNINPFISSFATYLLIDRIFNTLKIKRLNLEVSKLNTNAYKFDLSFGFLVYDEVKNDYGEYYLMFMNSSKWEQSKTTGLLKTLGKKLEKVQYKFI